MKYFSFLVLAVILSACLVKREWVDEELGLTEALHDIEIIDDQTKIVYGYGTGNIYKTTNNGEDWANIYQFDSIFFEEIQFFDENNGWIVGGMNKIFFTENGGANWQDKSLGMRYKSALICGMHFEKKEQWLCCCNSKVQRGVLLIDS